MEKARNMSAQDLTTETAQGQPSNTSTLNWQIEDLTASFHQATEAEEVGLHLSNSLCLRFAASLAAKRFLILCGLSGSGKTQIALAFSKWICPKDEEADCAYAVIPVGADWTGSDAILGYPDGLDKSHYVTKPALELIQKAMLPDNSDIPHLLILDEMNLSHVERYFADILSLIESGESLGLYRPEVDAEGEEIQRSNVNPKLSLPDNLFIIGTVNVDETTYMFSPKVLDRANVIEFRMTHQGLGHFLGRPVKPSLSNIEGLGASFGKAFVQAASEAAPVPEENKSAYQSEMLLFFSVLQQSGLEFGFRTAHEAARFIHFYKTLGKFAASDVSWFSNAFDCVILQKLLPKLHGSRAKLGPVLKKLWFLCVNDTTSRGAEALNAAEEAARSTEKNTEPSAVISATAPYPLSAEKINRMWRLLLENGFASFAEA